MQIESKIKRNIPLAPLTTFQIGGTAKFFIEIKEKEELAEAVEWAQNNNYPYYLLGGGSNVLINDGEIDGLFIVFKNNQIKINENSIEAQAGTPMSQIVRFAAANSLSGLEWANGLPGTLGGAIRGNAGCYGSQISDVIERVGVFDILQNKIVYLKNKECQFSYRSSIIKKDYNLIIWEGIIKLKKGDMKKIKSKMDEILATRSKTLPKLPSAGCIFKNLPFAKLNELNAPLAKQAREEGAVKGGSDGKVSAGWVIEKTGLSGKSIGGAKISLERGNFIVNTGNATAEEVVMLISFIKQQIRKKYNIQLAEEIQYIGF